MNTATGCALMRKKLIYLPVICIRCFTSTQYPVVLTETYNCDAKIKYVTPLEIAQTIDKDINPKKAPRIDEITQKILKELTRKGIVLLTSTHVFVLNTCRIVLKRLR